MPNKDYLDLFLNNGGGTIGNVVLPSGLMGLIFAQYGKLLNKLSKSKLYNKAIDSYYSGKILKTNEDAIIKLPQTKVSEMLSIYYDSLFYEVSIDLFSYVSNSKFKKEDYRKQVKEQTFNKTRALIKSKLLMLSRYNTHRGYLLSSHMSSITDNDIKRAISTVLDGLENLTIPKRMDALNNAIIEMRDIVTSHLLESIIESNKKKRRIVKFTCNK